VKLKEVEIGGVWNLGNYENLKLALRYEVESEGEIARVVDVVGKASYIVSTLRILYDKYYKLQDEIIELDGRLTEARRELEDCRREQRRQVEEILGKYSNVLKPEVIEEVKARLESGEYKVCIEKLSKIVECERIRNCEYYEEKYRETHERLGRAKEEVKGIHEAIQKLRSTLESGGIDEAYREAVEYTRRLRIAVAMEAGGE